ncbi:MAG TPA: type VI secretion system-associated FHA domain protein TagH [Burkholderiaceae bacterium]|nr:type VI secretion system-associated FHA domain protein TagH [Burkholderiaceae bacterium]
MTLTLRVVSLNDLPLTQPITAQFGAQGGTIGRADHNTMALPDPARYISRRQAEIHAGDSGYSIRNIGSANPISVRGEALAQGQTAPLVHGDLVRIGGYLLETIDETMSAGDGEPTVPQTGFEAPRLVSGPATTLAADADVSLGGGGFSDLVPDCSSGSIDDLFGLEQPGRDPLADFMSGAQASTASAADKLPVDPLELFGAVRENPSLEQAQPAFADHTPALQSAFRLPKLRQAGAWSPNEPPGENDTVPPASSRPAVPPGGDEAHALWRSFCNGAGIRIDPNLELTDELMHDIGRLLRSAVDGTLKMMAVRAATKHELHAEVTVIKSRDNNPLKFSPDGQSALEQLVRPPMRGFMAGPAAMADAMHDLVSHAIATMAGTRAALDGVLTRFRPETLESKLAGRSMLDSVLPLNRKAKLWDLYLQHFEAIRDEAQEDFNTLFGKAFLMAYEEQLKRLQESRSAA